MVAMDLVKEQPVTRDDPYYRLSVAQYQAMAAQGILTEDDRVELLEGLLIQKMTKNPRHIWSTENADALIQPHLPAGWFTRRQDPFNTGDSQPEPDVFVVRGKPRDYIERLPAASDVALVVEVADSTLAQDRTIKQRIYARAGIPVYWIINLVDNQIEVYTQPIMGAEPGYPAPTIYKGDDLLPLVIDGQEVARLTARELLP
jgi:Uma2 family endonuclease